LLAPIARRWQPVDAGRIDEPIGIEQIAAGLDTDRRHLAQAFRRAFGRSPHDVLREQRLRKVRELLTSTDLTLPEIARRAGFRKGMDGLAGLCRNALREDPFSGCVFVFRNRRATAIKVLIYGGQGFWLCQKRLSKGRFQWRPESAACASEKGSNHDV